MNKNLKRSTEMRHYLLPALTAALWVLIPGPAVADNECGPQQFPGTAETLNCVPGDFPNGIRYAADGDLTLVVASGTTDLNLNVDGVNLGASGTDKLRWDANAFTGIIRGSDGIILDLVGEAGDIDIVSNRITGSATASHGIRAITTSGDIGIVANGNITGVTTGIEALSVSGNLDVAAFGNLNAIGTMPAALNLATGGNVDLRLGGTVSDPVRVDTTAGAGSTVIEIDGLMQSTDIDVQTGAGALTVNLNPGATLFRSTVITRTQGNATINLRAGSAVDFTNRTLVDMRPEAGATNTLNIDTLVNGFSVRGTTGDRLAVRGGGAGSIEVQNRAGLLGGVDFSANSGGVRFYNHGTDAEHPEAEGLVFMNDGVHFGSGDDLLHNGIEGRIGSGMDDIFNGGSGRTPGAVLIATMEFGDGDDRFVNAGALFVGETTVEEDTFNSDPRAFQLDVLNLENFDNSGAIVLGAVTKTNPHVVIIDGSLICDFGGPCIDRYGRTDGEFSDVLSMPGVTFTGTGDSRIIMDAAFGLAVPQTGCTQRADRAGMWRLPGADCVDLSGGSTAGSTQIIVHERFAADVGAHNPDGLVVVDVSGGTSAAGHFVLSPESDRYNAALDGIDKGLFFFPLVYDEQTQQHKLLGLPGHRAYQMPLLVQSTQAIGRTHSQTWLGRQVDRRTAMRERGTTAENAIWGGITQAGHSREPTQSSGPTVLRNDYDQDITAVQAGVDWLRGESEAASWVVGSLFGYANSQVDFTTMGSQAEFDAVTAGLYAGYQHAAFYWDALLSGNWVQMDYDDAAFSDPTDPFDALKTQAQNIGIEAEAGWRLSWSQAYLEPLIGLSWVRSEFDTLTILPGNVGARPDNKVFGDNTPTSFRGALGARAGLRQAIGGLRADYRLTARFWNEFQGETVVRIQSVGPDAIVEDTFDTALSEVALGIGLENGAGSVSGHLQVDSTFGDDYDSLGLTAGFRYQW